MHHALHVLDAHADIQSRTSNLIYIWWRDPILVFGHIRHVAELAALSKRSRQGQNRGYCTTIHHMWKSSCRLRFSFQHADDENNIKSKKVTSYGVLQHNKRLAIRITILQSNVVPRKCQLFRRVIIQRHGQPLTTSHQQSIYLRIKLTTKNK